jgi:hemerythrin-like metal-binding protein
MDIIRWRESYETGIGSMDVQHRKLIDLMNTLFKMIRNQEANDSINEVLGEMNKYAEMHLHDEESILMNNNYPDLSNHIALHRNYREKVRMLIDESKNGNEAIINETYLFLRKWWMEHIVKEDKQYGEFLKSKGIK